MMKKLVLTATLIAGGAAVWLYTREDLDWPVTNDRTRGEVVVAFGDSLTRGFGAADGEAYTDHLSDLLGSPVINAGSDGESTYGGLRRLNQVLADEPDVVIITLGGNDILRRVSLEKTLENLRQIFERLQQAGAMVVYAAVDPPLIGSNWNAAVRNLCRQQGVLYVPSIMAGLWGDSERMHDSIHPNGLGYRLIAERIHARLAPHLENNAMAAGELP